MRVGIGFDVHPFGGDRALLLGGVEVRDTDGLEGHSDGDPICHALIDALLGAAGLGDIGEMFPQDQVEQGASSLELVGRTVLLITEAGYEVVNVDVTVICQSVRISPHRSQMIDALSAVLKIEPGAVSVKATTTDRLGAIGRGEGVGAIAVVLLSRAQSV